MVALQMFGSVKPSGNHSVRLTLTNPIFAVKQPSILPLEETLIIDFNDCSLELNMELPQGEMGSVGTASAATSASQEQVLKANLEYL